MSNSHKSKVNIFAKK